MLEIYRISYKWAYHLSNVLFLGAVGGKHSKGIM